MLDPSPARNRDGDSVNSLYRDPQNLKDFQLEDIVTLRRLGRGVLGWDTGMGKTRGLLGLACWLLDKQEIDTILLVCEQNKLGPDEWEGDIKALTTATWAKYHGARRSSVLQGELPQIIATTYETAREDIAVRDAEGHLIADGPLTRALAGRRVLIAYDEMPKLAIASSGLYQAHNYLVERIGACVVGLTAMAYTVDYESTYNMFLLVCPDVLPTREQFEELCVVRRRRRTNKAIFNDRAVRQYLLEPIRPYLLRRRKTDPEVAHLFPKMREKTLHTVMTPDQAEAYQTMEAFGRVEAERLGEEPSGLYTVLRMIASYPEALLAADGALAAETVQVLGAEWLASIRPGKLDMLQKLAAHAAAEDRKTVVFSFFGPTILPLLARDLQHLGVPILTFYGAATKARRESLAAFRAHKGPALLLASNAAARGINVPEASRLIEYEGALTYEIGAQRRNRIHRLDSPHDEVVCATLIADGTLEQPIAEKMLHRNFETDAVNGDEFAAPHGFTTASIRRSKMDVWQNAVA